MVPENYEVPRKYLKLSLAHEFQPDNILHCTGVCQCKHLHGETRRTEKQKKIRKPKHKLKEGGKDLIEGGKMPIKQNHIIHISRIFRKRRDERLRVKYYIINF